MTVCTVWTLRIAPQLFPHPSYVLVCSLANRVSMLRFSSSQSCIHFMPAVCGTCFPRVPFMQCAVTCLVLIHTLVSSAS